MRYPYYAAGLAVLLCLGACNVNIGSNNTLAGDSTAVAAGSDTASAYGGYIRMTSDELERDRMNSGWRQFVQLDSLPEARADGGPGEEWTAITPEAVNTGKMLLPLGGDVKGPSVLRAQILLDRARFSPGVMDGRWGMNTEKAVYWFQRREGLKATGQVDSTTFRKLAQAAGDPQRLVERYTLTEADVKGPYEPLPEDIYEKAKLDSMAYESLSEMLAERFHTTPALLAQLNPNTAIDSLKAGATLAVPNVQGAPAPAGQAARILVSDGGHYVHALDASGRILYHFPSTLGSSYDPSPEAGEYEITKVTKNPWWHYQPDLLAHVPDSEKDARIPPGPNNAVGLVWISLSKPHFGIHGTSAPETIGYASSAGCVRLTNWDVLFLADRVAAGTPVEFRDQDGREAAADASQGGQPAAGKQQI